MDPDDARARPTGVRRIALAVAALALPLALAACGSDDDAEDVATDPTPTTATASPNPTAAPTVGSYPAFEPEDYTFQLVVSCFCMGSGVPILVTVVDAEVVGAIYAADDPGRSGVKQGDPAPETFQLTVNDVIDAANDTEAAHVEVEWPAGQAYPSSVFVDQDENTIDEEIGYAIADVQVA